jgi:putative tryptophan/tyrosine transport system substrate-binding protein
VRDGAIDAILADSTPAAVAARRATKTIPIVAYIAVDPVAAGCSRPRIGSITQAFP